MAIGTRTEYKTYAGIGHTGLDTRIDLYLSAAESAMERFCGVDDFGTATYTEQEYDGQGDYMILLKNWPVTAVSAVKLACYTTTVTLDSTGYAWDSRGKLWRENGPGGQAYTDDSPVGDWYEGGWPKGHKNVKVTYTAGYSTIPDDLKLIQYEMVDAMVASAGRDPSMQSESIDSYSYSLRSTADKWSNWTARMGAFQRVTL